MRDCLARWALVGAAVLVWSCGGSEASEKAKRQSDRYYQAAYVAWSEEGDNLAAIRALTRAIEEDPENHRAHYLLGTLRLGRQELDEAETHLREAVRIRLVVGNRADLAEAQNSLGVLLIHRKQLDEAVVVLEESSGEVLNREPWLALGNLGWAYIELGEYDSAVQKLRRALFDQPRFCVGLYRLGQAHYLNKELGPAEENLRKALAVPDSGCERLQDAHRILGLICLRDGRDAEARELFEKCVEISPGSEPGRACAEALGDR